MSSWSGEDDGVGESDGDGNRMGIDGVGVDVASVDGVQAGIKVTREAACTKPESTPHANNTTRSKTTVIGWRAFKRLWITKEEICKRGGHKSSSSKLELPFIYYWQSLN